MRNLVVDALFRWVFSVPTERSAQQYTLIHVSYMHVCNMLHYIHVTFRCRCCVKYP